MSRRIPYSLIALALAMDFGPLAVAQAEDASLGRATYLREGPGPRYRPLDQAPAGARVEVTGCADGWCRAWLGDAAGYLPQEALARAVSPVTVPADARCFVSREAGRGAGRAVEFCPAGTAR